MCRGKPPLPYVYSYNWVEAIYDVLSYFKTEQRFGSALCAQHFANKKEFPPSEALHTPQRLECIYVAALTCS